MTQHCSPVVGSNQNGYTRHIVSHDKYRDRSKLAIALQRQPGLTAHIVLPLNTCVDSLLPESRLAKHVRDKDSADWNKRSASSPRYSTQPAPAKASNCVINATWVFAKPMEITMFPVRRSMRLMLVLTDFGNRILSWCLMFPLKSVPCPYNKGGRICYQAIESPG